MATKKEIENRRILAKKIISCDRVMIIMSSDIDKTSKSEINVYWDGNLGQLTATVASGAHKDTNIFNILSSAIQSVHERQAKEAGVNPKVIFDPRKEEVIKYLRMADFGVLVFGHKIEGTQDIATNGNIFGDRAYIIKLLEETMRMDPIIFDVIQRALLQYMFNKH